MHINNIMTFLVQKLFIGEQPSMYELFTKYQSTVASLQ